MRDVGLPWEAEDKEESTSEQALVVPSETAILATEDLGELGKIEELIKAVGRLASQWGLDLAETNDLVKRLLMTQIRIGEIYTALPDDPGGRPEKPVTLSNEFSPKQQAETEVGKTRKTLCQWASLARVPGRYERAAIYIANCANAQEEATLKDAYHAICGVVAQKYTGNPENYTPPWVIEKVRATMGDIDLDPASCELAQEAVKAQRYFMLEDDGLSQPWQGRVFLNPPYKMPDIERFVDKMVSEPIDQGILLTNNNTDTKWFHLAARACGVICFTAGRINFYTEGIEKTQPTNGQAFFYFGVDGSRFIEVFQEVGLIMETRRS